MMAYSEDHIALAAEYALGTLDAEERAQVETMMSVDTDFTATVEAWQHKLGVLNQMVGSVEPRPEVWEKIKSAAGLAGPQAPLLLPEAPPLASPQAEVVEPAAPVADPSNVVRLSAQTRRWRTIASFTTAIAAALVAMIAVGAYQPNLLPDRFRPAAKTQMVEVKTTPPAAASQPSAQYVAVLQKESGAPGFILTVDEASKKFTIRRVGAPAELGNSYELWLISDKLPKPRSLGVVGSGDFTSRPVLASYDTDIIKAATYAVTVEQGGGSPDGAPHSAPVFAGKLIEAVPPAR
jgi:anti-sigma-K factor RskA